MEPCEIQLISHCPLGPGGVAGGDAINKNKNIYDAINRNTNIYDAINRNTNIHDAINRNKNIIDAINRNKNIHDAINRNTNIIDAINRNTNIYDAINRNKNIYMSYAKRFGKLLFRILSFLYYFVEYRFLWLFSYPWQLCCTAKIGRNSSQ